MRSNFGLAPGGKLTLNFRSDGRQVRVFLGGQEVPFAAPGKTFRVVIERKDASVIVTGAGDEGGPVARTVELPAAARGPTAIAVRITGMPARPTGMVLTSAIVRGPASLPPPTPE
jgi:hypothetical protein